MSRKTKISRRKFLAGAGAAGAATVLGSTLYAHLREQQYTYLPRVTRSLESDRPNIISIVLDTLRYDHVGFHGNAGIHTPNIDAFAAESQVFDKAYAAGFPTVLNRAEFLTGRYMYTRMGWADLPEDELVLADVLNNAGYTTGLVFDTLHYKDHFTFNRAFQSWEWVRGQEEDRWRATPLNPPLPADPSKFRHGAAHVQQYLRNMSTRSGDDDFMAARTFKEGINWLRHSGSENAFYLHIDSFDPHEPFDAPQSYVDLYDPGYVGESVIYPAYAPPDYLTAAELNHVRALYKAEVTMVDHWFGNFLNELANLGLDNNTIVILFSDHGFLFGEHNAVGKSWDTETVQRSYPMWEELVHVPLMVRMPGMASKRIAALAQPADLLPTILEMAGVADPGTTEGVSLLPVINDGTSPTHPAVVAGRSLKTPLAQDPLLMVTDGEWSLQHGGGHVASMLYHLPSDPQQQNNVLGSNCATARSLHSYLINFLESLNTEAALLDPWRPAPC